MSLIRDKNLFYLFFIWIVLANVIFVNTYIFNGFLSNDSTSYLRLAKNILNGDGLSLLSLDTEQNRQYFAVWPIGYPVLIALVGKITGLTVLWSSKLLNIIFIGLILIIFKKLFKETAYIYGLIFFFAGYLEIITFSYTELPFIFGSVWFAASAFWFTQENISLKLGLSLVLASIFMFLMRYIGALSIGMLGILFIYILLFQNNKKKALFTLVIISIASTFMALYLYNNYIETGFYTGVERVKESLHIRLFTTLFSALLSEVVIPMRKILSYSIFIPIAVIQFFLVGYFIYKHKKNIISKVDNSENFLSLHSIFFFFGISYLGAIIFLRFRTQFDYFDYRLLGPGTFLLFIALIKYLEQHKERVVFNDFKKIMIFLSIISLLINFVGRDIKGYLSNSITEYESRTLLNEILADIPQDSLIITNDTKVKFFRSDVYILIGNEKGIETKFVNNIKIWAARHKNRSIFVIQNYELVEKISAQKYLTKTLANNKTVI